MALVDTLRNWFGYGQSTTYDSTVLNKRGEFAGYDRDAIARLFYDQNKANHAVYSVIKYCADSLADTLRFGKIVDKNGNEITNHWSCDLLLNNPSKGMGTKEFGYAYGINRLLFGDAFIYLIRGIGMSAGEIKEMIVAHTQDVTFDEVTGYNWMQPKERYRIKTVGIDRLFNADEILRIYSYNVDSCSDYGLSPLVPAAILAEKILTGSVSEAMMFKNGGPETLLFNKQTVEGRAVSWSEQNIADYNHELNDKRGKRVKLINTALDKIDIGKSPIDLGILNSTEAGLKSLMFVYKLPYSLYSGDGTFNNTKEGYKALYTQVGIPLANEFLDNFTRLCGFKNGEYWTIDEQRIPQLKDDAVNTLAAYDKAYASINERRQVIGLMPLPNAEYNEPLIPLNVTAGIDTETDPIK